MKLLLTFLLMGFALSACGLFGEEWQAFYYPEGCLACKDQWEFSPILDSYEDCAAWAQNHSRKRLAECKSSTCTDRVRQDYAECGVDCSLHKDLDIYICDETLDAPL